MELEYRDIYSRFYLLMTDTQFFEQPEDVAYEKMNLWLHDIASLPQVRKTFNEITFDDEIQTLTYELNKSIDEDSDKDFVIKLFAQGMIIYWMRPRVESAINLATVIGSKEEKRLLSNYKTVIERLNQNEINFKKLIRDHEYWNGDIVTTS